MIIMIIMIIIIMIITMMITVIITIIVVDVKYKNHAAFKHSSQSAISTMHTSFSFRTQRIPILYSNKLILRLDHDN